ncbi:MAG TPA: adenylosuccinate synthetase [Telluria sp.]|nr:adenylosuccinate synthetase [Telluria sp.]
MGTVRLVSIIGLGFGDCGKGLFTDYFCRRWNAHTVVRFNGGAQAGHNVVLPDGRSHTFSQFGAGTFVPGTATLLAYPVIVHPTALLVEDGYLRRAGVEDALARLLIDARCRVTSPFHQAAGRMRELERGAQAHGSCGVGVGETAHHALLHPEQAITYRELADPALAMEKLALIRATLLAGFNPICAVRANQLAYDAERRVLLDAEVPRRWLGQLQSLIRRVPPASREAVAERLHLPGTVLFEGAQGVLLDEWRGFHPHTTWSSIAPASVEAVALDAGQHTKIDHFGALRTYMTRHGAGPLPTHDVRLDHLLEPHNGSDGWQGRFRRGHPDVLLLRYALAVAAPLDGLLVSHLDVFERERGLKWCVAYDVPEPGGHALIGGLVQGVRGDLEHQAKLAQLLANARPRYAPYATAGAFQFLSELEALARLPVLFGSRGPTHQAVTPFGAAP